MDEMFAHPKVRAAFPELLRELDERLPRATKSDVDPLHEVDVWAHRNWYHDQQYAMADLVRSA
jgi:hypothetical protein